MDELKQLVEERLATRVRDPNPIYYDLILECWRNASDPDKAILNFLEAMDSAEISDQEDFFAFCETLVKPTEYSIGVSYGLRETPVADSGSVPPSMNELKVLIQEKINRLTRQQLVPGLIMKYERQLEARTGKRPKDFCPEIYVSKQLYSAIISRQKRYSKWTLIKISFGLQLNLQEATELLEAAGYAFNSGKMDTIIKTCLEIGYYDVSEIDELLYCHGLQTFNPEKENELSNNK